MADTRGRCTNFDYCALAESRREIDLRPGDRFICPECGKPLQAPIQSRPPGPGAGLVVLIALLLGAALGGAVIAGIRLTRAGAPPQHPVAIATRPNRATPDAPAPAPATPRDVTSQAPPATPSAGPNRLQAFTARAVKWPKTFHFRPGSTELDDVSVHDLVDLVNSVVTRRATGDKLIVAGFADDQGDQAANLSVSKIRADAVAAALAKYGLLAAKVAGFGADFPVADNATDTGRNRNRRVDVYILP